MEDPSYYSGPTVIESYSDENNNNKTYVNLEVVQRNANPYDPAAIELAHQADLLFNYDSSPTHHQDQQQSHHHVHHHHLPIISGPSTHHTVLHHYQHHDMDPSRNHHLLDLDNCGSKSFDSIKSVLLLKDMNSDSQQHLQQQNAAQITFLSTDSRIKSEPQMDSAGSGGGGALSGGPVPFWKERALQIERGAVLYGSRKIQSHFHSLTSSSPVAEREK